MSDQPRKLKHLAIIMDGNRRWARKKGLPILEGHRKGLEVFQKVGQWCLDRDIEILTVWAFSTENWKRSRKEVGYLMNLFRKALTEKIKELHTKGIRLKVLGRRKDLPQDLQKKIAYAEKLTQNNKRGLLNLAINYGGRAEIVDAIKKIIRKKIPPQKITQELIDKFLYTAFLPEPDLIIRTSGEKRLSGFLIWQAAYSELYFCPKYWPDFTEKDLDKAIRDFYKRKRRFGGD